MKRVLITGATSGIGKALVLKYLTQGWQVLACGRDAEKLQHLKHDCESRIDKSHQADDVLITLCFDITDQSAYADIEAFTQALDLVIFNAGDCQYLADPMHFDSKLFNHIIDVNLLSIGYGLEAWLRHIRRAGRVVFISSSAQMLPFPKAEAYGASKAALTYLARSLSIDLARFDIRVSVVHPGFVDTPLTEKNDFSMPFMISVEEAAERIESGISKGKHTIAFPRRLIWSMNLLKLLPFSWWRAIFIQPS